jgi:SARP family transcriptional regulator, regulator of embCAB operon
VVGAHVVADVREHVFVGVGAGDVAAFALDLSGHENSFRRVRDVGAIIVLVVSAGSTIQLCGRYVVELEGERIEARLPGRQGRLLFAHLALNRDRAVGRSELVEAVWPGELPRDPSDALAALLSKLRTALGDRYLHGRGEIQLLLPADARLDVEQGITAAHEAESACSLRDWPRAWGASLCAQLVAKRTLLGEYEAPWIDEWRRTLADVLVRALECYATACLGLGGTELAGAERAARQLVRSAPLRESAAALLMQALEDRGNAAEALLVYESLRLRLRDDLGVAPSEQLQSAYRRLLGAPAAG